MLTKPRLADVVPDACGVNTTLNVAALPAGIVSGTEIPLIVNSELFPQSEEMVMAALLAVSVALCVALFPTVTLPKLKLLGLTLSWPGVTPVPLKATETAGFEASEAIESPPLLLPVEVGEKDTLNVRF